jgi:hypothetical protein
VRTAELILKWLSQILIVATGIAGILRAHAAATKDTKRPFTTLEKLSIAAMIVGFFFFAFTDIRQQNERAALIKENRNRDIAGIEISFTPTSEEWSQIVAAFDKTPRFVAEIPNSAAAIKAERTMDNWKIEFDEVKRIEGSAKFPRVLGSDPKGKPFAEVIDAASPALWIKWGTNVQTEIDPRAHLYPSAIYISESKIAVTLRSPELKLKLNQLNEDFVILIRSSTRPATLRFVSLDERVTLNQTIKMEWREDNGIPQVADIVTRTKPYVSGPHKLQATLKS